MRVTRMLALACLVVVLAACQSSVGRPMSTPAQESGPTPPATPISTTPPAPASERPPDTPAPTRTPAESPLGSATPAPPERPTDPPTQAFAPTGATEVARVVRVVDGDTIRVAMGGEEYPLRYIGIDTPETVHPSRPVEWMGREASETNRQLVDGRTVVLETDISETDRYGRLLRYVWIEDGGGWLLVNLELVRLGFAQVSTYPPDVKYTELYLDAQREAREAGRGLWGDPPHEDHSGANSGTGALGSGGSCDAAYPTVCIPPSPPDIDCGDIGHRRFEVLPPDPHRFDGDHDGIGCESG